MIDWGIVAWITFGVFIALLAIRIISIIVIKNKQAKHYNKNQLLVKDLLLNNQNKAYKKFKPSRNLEGMISEYIIDKDNNLIIEYGKNNEEKPLALYLYNKKDKLIEVKFFNKEKDAKHSNVIKLSKKVNNINILVNETNEEINTQKLTRVKSLFDTLILLSGLIFIIYWLLYYYMGVRINYYLINEDGLIYIGLILLLVGILNYFITNYFLIRRTIKEEEVS